VSGQPAPFPGSRAFAWVCLATVTVTVAVFLAASDETGVDDATVIVLVATLFVLLVALGDLLTVVRGEQTDPISDPHHRKETDES
jgi:hypothetical protein